MPRFTRFVRSGLTVMVTTVALAASVLPAWACDESHRDGHGSTPDVAGASHQGHGAAAGGAAAADAGAVKNVKLRGTVPGAQGAIAANFLQYGNFWAKRDVMLVSGEFGLKAYDLTKDPTKPKLISELSMPGMWETEDTDVDPERKLVFLSRDPRAFGGTTATGKSGIYIVDASNPDKLALITFVEVPAGHTTTCVERCRYLWTGGPSKAATMPADWGGRPVWVTDVRDPAKPKVFPNPIDTGRNDGKTDYTHDVQVDGAGVAWASGRGGVRGYWTNGLRYDPVAKKMRMATAWDPVPYAGGGIDELAAPSKFLHNSYRPAGLRYFDGPDPWRWRNDELIFSTEESFASGCAADGVLVISSIKGSYDGQGWRSTPQNPFRLQTVGTWGVAGKEGTNPASSDCSAHYFDVRGKILVQSFYSQGTRFLDISDPTKPTQIAYHRPADTASWAPYFHGDYIYVADNTRGIDILQLTTR